MPPATSQRTSTGPGARRANEPARFSVSDVIDTIERMWLLKWVQLSPGLNPFGISLVTILPCVPDDILLPRVSSRWSEPPAPATPFSSRSHADVFTLNQPG